MIETWMELSPTIETTKKNLSSTLAEEERKERSNRRKGNKEGVLYLYFEDS